MPGDLQGITLSDLQSYLSRTEWELLDEDDRTSMWRLVRYEQDFRVVLPSGTKIADYRELIVEAVRTVSYVERRTPEEVLSDVRVPGGTDSVSVRLVPDAPAGEAPLGLASDAITALRQYVIGSASALEIPDALVLPSRRPLRAEQFAAQTRLSTSPGSFIVHLSVPVFGDVEPEPVESRSQLSLIPIPPSPYGRRVVHRMRSAADRAVQLARAVGEGDEQVRVFGTPQAGAPNATELEALATLGGEDRLRYQLRFAESRIVETSSEPWLLPVTPAEQIILKEAAEFLRTKQPRAGVTVVGLVVRLHRTGAFGPGEAVIQGVDDDSGVERRFGVSLNEEDYNAAVRAHSMGLQVMATGDVIIAGTRRALRPLTAFSILPGLED
jgi:hypothetical protein